MLAYQYSSSGYYLGPVEADESPLEPGVYHLPARSTLEMPPHEVPDGMCPRWNGVGWDLATAPVITVQDDPVAKLKSFLAQNPDVAAMLS